MWKSSGIGLVLVGAGVLYLLVQLHILPLTLNSSVVWSLLLILFGFMSFQGTQGRIPVWGIFLIVLGAVYLAKYAAHVAYLRGVGDWTLFFGLAIIFAGLQMLLPSRWRKRRKFRVHMSTEGNRVIDVGHRGHESWRKMAKSNKRIIGDISIGQQPWVLKDLDLWNGIGDVRVNLGTARFEEGTYHIDIGGWIGDIRVLVPDSLPVRVSANLGIGDVTIFDENQSGARRNVSYEDPAFEEATARVILQADLKIGDIEIVRV
jgi:lia operon protein LiaF